MPSSAVYPMWESILCYNRGCYQKYNPKKNSEDCCQYHPEAPDFRDGKNSWICCNKTFNNLTEFLKTPGCAKGPHSIVRLEDEPEYISSQIIGDDDDKNYAELNPKVSENDIACKNRISENRAARLERFFQIFTDFDVTKFFRHSLEQNCLARIEKFGQLHPDVAQKHRYISHEYDSDLDEGTKNLIYSSTIDHDEIFLGEACKNNDCETIHEGIIHQLDGSHKWKKDKCRYDWYQHWKFDRNSDSALRNFCSYVTMVIYGKKYDPDLSYVEVNSVRLKCHLVFSEQTVG